MGTNIYEAIFFIVAGLFSITCAAKDWDWFMNNHKARFFVNFLGRDGARVMYVILGLFIMGVGLVLAQGH